MERLFFCFGELVYCLEYDYVIKMMTDCTVVLILVMLDQTGAYQYGYDDNINNGNNEIFIE